MSKIKLIALDMDGTLLNDEEIVTDYTKRVIKRAIDAGIEVVISTGRPIGSCISYAKDLQLPSYVITSNGGQIFTMDQELIEEHTMDAEKIEKLWNIGYERNLHMWIIATDAVFVEGRRPSDFHKHQWLKIGYSDLKEIDKLYVMEKLKQIGSLEITNSTPSNLEVNEAGVNKEAALKFLCKRIGITMDEVMTVGDSLNDFKMIKGAGIGVAVSNAQDEILDIADYVTLSNNEDGVAKAIEKFAL